MDKNILKIALDTKKNSFLEKHTHSYKLKNSTCGDFINVYLIIRKQKIKNFKFLGEFCIYCQASANLLSKLIINKQNNKTEHLLKIIINKSSNFNKLEDNNWREFVKILNKTNVARKECFLLPIKATLKALENK
tara:strand:+ start:57 stop:458 length:402 start_codon:yes stop_codon:yes gene_type:complete